MGIKIRSMQHQKLNLIIKDSIDLQRVDRYNINLVYLLSEIKRGLNRKFYFLELNATVENSYNCSTGLFMRNPAPTYTYENIFCDYPINIKFFLFWAATL